MLCLAHTTVVVAAASAANTTQSVRHRFKEEQVFEEVIETQIRAVSLIEGQWYVRLDGDLAGKVVGAVYDASAGEQELTPMALSVSE